MIKKLPIWLIGKCWRPFLCIFDQADGIRYNVSKLLEVFYCRELADHLKKSKKPAVVLNFLNPGLCHSELGRDAGWGLTILKFFLARTTEAGSRTLVAAAYAGTESHGQYLSNCRVTP